MPTWIRVRDNETGATYDVDERSLRAGMTVLPNYPPNSGPYARPRPTKYPPADLPRRAAQADAPKPQQAEEPAGSDGGG